MACSTVLTSSETCAETEVWITPRPWISLYGQYLKTNSHASAQAQDVRLAPIQQLLTDELTLLVFRHLNAESLARAGATCKHWRRLAHMPRLWQELCREEFQPSEHSQNLRLVKAQYGYSWKRMYIQRPRIRCDGIYVSRNTYFRVGVVDLETRNPVHLVVYYRYFRFFRDGTVLTRTSPEVLRNVWRSMYSMPLRLERNDSRLPGRWRILGSSVYVACMYPGCCSSEMRCKLQVRSRYPGVFNRMDIAEIFTYDRHDGSRVTLEDPTQEDEAQAKNPSTKGLTTMVFVPWNEVTTHILNLGKREMDVFIPG